MTGSLQSRKYAVGATVLELEGEPRFTPMDAMLAPAAAPADAGTTYCIETRIGTPPAAEGDLVFEGEVPDDGHCIMRQAGETTHLEFPGSHSLSLHPGRRRARIVSAPAADAVPWTIWMMALEAALDAGRHTLLHAAGLGIPGTGEAVLLYAPSGTGKSTASLALASAGFSLLSDDAVVIGREEDGKAEGGPPENWIAWGLPRPVKIHRNTAAMLPFLEPAIGADWDVNGEQPVGLGALDRLMTVEAATSRRIAAIIHLARAEGSSSRVERASRADILASLAADNVRTGRTGLLPQSARKFAILAALAAAVPVLRLEAGTDLVSIGRVVLDALEDAKQR